MNHSVQDVLRNTVILRGPLDVFGIIPRIFVQIDSQAYLVNHAAQKHTEQNNARKEKQRPDYRFSASFCRSADLSSPLPFPPDTKSQ